MRLAEAIDREVIARSRLEAAQRACSYLRLARTALRNAGAGEAANYAARALKSAEGAVRHAEGLLNEAIREKT